MRFVELVVKPASRATATATVTDLVLSALQLLREDIQEVVDSIKPVEP